MPNYVSSLVSQRNTKQIGRKSNYKAPQNKAHTGSIGIALDRSLLLQHTRVITTKANSTRKAGYQQTPLCKSGMESTLSGFLPKIVLSLDTSSPAQKGIKSSVTASSLSFGLHALSADVSSAVRSIQTARLTIHLQYDHLGSPKIICKHRI